MLPAILRLPSPNHSKAPHPSKAPNQLLPVSSPPSSPPPCFPAHLPPLNIPSPKYHEFTAAGHQTTKLPHARRWKISYFLWGEKYMGAKKNISLISIYILICFTKPCVISIYIFQSVVVFLQSTWNWSEKNIFKTYFCTKIRPRQRSFDEYAKCILAR